MSELRILNDDELHTRTVKAARREQEMTLVTLAHLREVERRMLHLKMSYGSIFSYAVGLGFSEPAAAQRIHAMNLVSAVPEAQSKLESGELDLSKAAALQKFIKQEEKTSERTISAEEKGQMVAEISGKSLREAERILLSHASNPEPHRMKETERPATSTRTELRFFANEEFMGNLNRVRELKGSRTLEEIFSDALVDHLKRIDPLRKKKVNKSTKAPELKACNESSKRAEPACVSEPDSNSVLTAPTTKNAHARVPTASQERALYARSGRH